MAKKRIVMALGHNALGTNLPEQKEAAAKTSKMIADFIQDGWQVAVVHSNAPQLRMIHTAMNEFGKQHEGYTSAPMSVCSAMSQGYIGYDLQNAIRTELIRRGIYKPVASILTQVMVNPYDEAFYTPAKAIGRYMSAEDAKAEEDKGNFVEEVPGKGYRRVVASPKPVSIVEGDVIKAVLDADQIVIACGGGGIPVMEQGYRLKGAGGAKGTGRALRKRRRGHYDRDAGGGCHQRPSGKGSGRRCPSDLNRCTECICELWKRGPESSGDLKCARSRRINGRGTV